MVKKLRYQGPLAGLNVIDFGHYYAGPMAGMLLADQGAKVIRIVRPGEVELPEQQHRLLNRNKKLLELDLKTEESKAQALSLIEKADVLIENFRPGVMKRLGLDYSSVKDRNPGLVYLSLPGFASTDKARAHIQAWEGVIAAASGLYTDLSLIRQRFKFPPVYTSVPHSSMYAATHGAIAVMAALLAREDHGLGTVIETPLYDAALSAFSIAFVLGGSAELMARAGWNFTDLPEALQGFAFSAGDSDAEQIEKLDKAREATAPVFGNFFECADGRVVFLWACDRPTFADRLVRALRIDKQLKREGYVTVNSAWESDLDNNLGGSSGLSPDRRKRLMSLLRETFLTKPSAEWEKILVKARIPFGPIRTRNEWLALQPMIDSGVLTQMDDRHSRLTVPGRVVDISGPEGVLMSGFNEPAPTTFKVAANLFDSKAANKPGLLNPACQKKSDMLKGLKVLDLSNVVAGPISSYTLAQYGADVIKLDFPDHQSPFLMAGMLEINQGKRNMLVDLRTVPGMDILSKLVSWADVVIHNVLDETAMRMGLTHARLQQMNPDVITCQLSCFGGPNRGGWENRLGFDPVAQCDSGLMAHYGTPQSPHWHGGTAAADTFGGVNLAFTSLLAVYQKRRTGFSGEGRTSLARAVNFYQLPHMIAENGRSDWGEARGQCAMGEHWSQRIYRCRDKWIYVGTAEQDAHRFAELVTGHKEGDEKTLEAAFARHDGSYWLRKLSASEIACHEVQTFSDILAQGARTVPNEPADEMADAALDVLHYQNHPYGCPVTHLGSTWVRIGESRSYSRLYPAPRFGQHTIEVLRELGYDNNQITDLLTLKIAYDFLPALGSSKAYFFEPEGV